MLPLCYGRYSMEFHGKRTKLFANGRAVDFSQCLMEQQRRYPASQIRDLVKLAYQAAFGAAHGVADRGKAWKYFTEEFSRVRASDDLPLFEVISPDFCRVNLGAWKKAGLPGKWLFNMFCASAEPLPESQRLFAEYIRQIRAAAGKRQKELDDFMKRYSGGAVHHSEVYRQKYHPSYRLISSRFLTVLPVLAAAAALPEKEIAVIAIDGRSASGKTTLSRQLALILEAGVIHMDDFFLPQNLRTAGRLAEPGGNIHYERFRSDILPRLRQGVPFSYQRFDCSKMQPGSLRHISVSRWRIVEGAYSLHPRFGNYADLKVFYDISPAEQLKRIRQRNGERMASVFAQRWIPMEEKYITAFKIKQQADVILGGKE